MSDGHGLSSLQLTLITGTLLIANLAAFWLIRKNFFKESEDEKKEREADSDSDFSNSILSETEWKEFELIEKKIITHNTSIYRFKLPTEDSVLPLPIGQVMKRKRNKLIIIII
jgi:hypothetical protein